MFEIKNWISENLLKEILKDFSAIGGSVVMGTMAIGIAFFDFDLALRLIGGMLIVMIGGYLIKALFRTQRPDHLHRPAAAARIDQLDASSFPSIHASRMGMCMAVLFSISSWPFQVFLVGLTIAVCASRVLLRRHDMADVLGGLMFGIGVGVLLMQF